jgi:hypothetical protein
LQVGKYWIIWPYNSAIQFQTVVGIKFLYNIVASCYTSFTSECRWYTVSNGFFVKRV